MRSHTSERGEYEMVSLPVGVSRQHQSADTDIDEMVETEDCVYDSTSVSGIIGDRMMESGSMMPSEYFSRAFPLGTSGSDHHPTYLKACHSFNRTHPALMPHPQRSQKSNTTGKSGSSFAVDGNKHHRERKRPRAKLGEGRLLVALQDELSG